VTGSHNIAKTQPTKDSRLPGCAVRMAHSRPMSIPVAPTQSTDRWAHQSEEGDLRVHSQVVSDTSCVLTAKMTALYCPPHRQHKIGASCLHNCLPQTGA